MNPEQEVMIRISLANVNRIVNVLSQGQYSQVYDLIDLMRNQAIAQLQPPSTEDMFPVEE